MNLKPNVMFFSQLKDTHNETNEAKLPRLFKNQLEELLESV